MRTVATAGGIGDDGSPFLFFQKFVQLHIIAILVPLWVAQFKEQVKVFGEVLYKAEECILLLQRHLRVRHQEYGAEVFLKLRYRLEEFTRFKFRVLQAFFMGNGICKLRAEQEAFRYL